MPTKTIYVREADLPVWEEALRIHGEKSMSKLFVECLKKELKSREGFLHVLRAEPGARTANAQFVVMFGPLDANGAMKPHYCKGIHQLKMFLGELGLAAPAVSGIAEEVVACRSSSVRVSLPQSRIDMIWEN